MICGTTRVELLLLFFVAVNMIGHIQGRRPRNKMPRLKELKNGKFACRPRRCPDGQKTSPPFCECSTIAECAIKACPLGERFDERKCDCVPGCFLETCASNQILDTDLCACVTESAENTVNTGNNDDCQVPSAGCPLTYRWDPDLCICSATTTTKIATVEEHAMCEMPGDGCEPGYVWNAIQCQCRWLQGSLDNNFCSDPPVACPNHQKWDKDLCACRPRNGITTCRPPNKGCRNGRKWDSNRCKCVRPESIINEEMIAFYRKQVAERGSILIVNSANVGKPVTINS